MLLLLLLLLLLLFPAIESSKHVEACYKFIVKQKIVCIMLVNY